MLVSAMVAAAMTGCGNASAGTEAADNANTTEDSTAGDSSHETASGSPVEVEFWYAGGKTAVGVVQEIVDSFNESVSRVYCNAGGL
mgnify:CR=1 FL=1